MRRLCLILLCGLIAAPVAVAAQRATGDGLLELRGVDATSLVISGTRGTLWGQMDKGKLTVTDPSLGDGQIYVTGADGSHAVNDNVTVYWGRDIHFRVTGGKYRLSFKGLGIDLSAVGVGTMSIIGDYNSLNPGHYAVDGKWADVPFVSRTVSFGVQPVTTP